MPKALLKSSVTQCAKENVDGKLKISSLISNIFKLKKIYKYK